MKLKSSAAIVSIVALVMVPAPKAQADIGEALAIGIIGAIIAGAATQGSRTQGSRPQQSRQGQRPAVSAEQRQQNRDVQTALNYFDFPVGTVDGAFGPRTRAGIRDYEIAMGFTVDGTLSDTERNFLLDSFRRAQTGAQVAPYSRIFAREGTRGLLRTYRNEQLGIPTPGVTRASVPAPSAQAPVSAPAAAAPVAALPSFGRIDANTGASVNNHCSQIQVLTTTNGGFTTLSTMSDPEFTLDEQFCLTRTNAMAEASNAMAGITGISNAQFVQQCTGLGDYMRAEIDKLGTTTPAAMQTDTARRLQGSGRSEAELRGSGVICLGVGYREDRADIVLGAALVMLSIDEPAYGEVIAHHLRGGFGLDPNPTRAEAWMERTLSRLEAGATPAFLPNQSADRVALLRAAMSGEVPAPVPRGLPSFGVPETR